MAYSQYQDDYRNEIADDLLRQQSKANTPLGKAMAAIPSNAMRQFTPASMAAGPAGMPTTPAGGVPGSGLAAAGPSNMPLPQAAMAAGGPMPAMPMQGAPPGTRGAMPAPMPMPAPMQMAGNNLPPIGGMGMPTGMPNVPMPTVGGVDASGMMPPVRGNARGSGRMRGYY